MAIDQKYFVRRFTITFIITKNCSMTCLNNIRLILKLSFKIVFSVHSAPRLNYMRRKEKENDKYSHFRVGKIFEFGN